MAEAKHTRICECCGTEFYTNISKQIICSETCRKVYKQKQKQIAAKNKRHASYGLDMSDRSCLFCNSTFSPKRIDSFFCSEPCRSKSNRLKRIEKHKKEGNRCSTEGCDKHVYIKNLCHAHYSKSMYLAKDWKNKECLHCKSKFVANGKAQKFCSRKCAYTHNQRQIGVKPAHRVSMSVCKECGVEFKPRKTEFSTFCSRECSFVHISKTGNRKGNRYSDAEKSCKERRKRRIKENGREHIVKTKVFERDKWTCHICGCKTPKSKRGTMSMNSPELDHIIPIAVGGSHTYSNVACACKRCNIKKSTKPLGQLNLGII
jgi:hypothetical protein